MEKPPMKQVAAETVGEANARFHELIARGETVLPLRFDQPTKSGYDSDHPKASGEVGKTGLVVNSLDDMESLFAGIPILTVKPLFTPAASNFMLLAFYVALAAGKGLEPGKISGFVQLTGPGLAGADRGIYPDEYSRKIDKDLSEWCHAALPGISLQHASVAGVSYDHSETMPKERGESFPPLDGNVGQTQIIKLAALRRQRDLAKCDQLLQLLNDTAAAGENIMPAVLEAAQARCTLGEIADMLREVFGES